MITLLLHGFWGQPGDWNAVLQRLPISQPVLTPDLYDDGPLGPARPLNEWTDGFWSWVDENVGTQPVQIVGYSMGGRLALNALMRRPERVSRALLLSANPVIPAEAHAEREAWEVLWRERFRAADWKELESAWQEQPVFNSTQASVRRQSRGLRELLGLSLTNWSPRLHPFGWKEVENLGSRVDWAFGALDQKYVSIAKTLRELPVKGQINVIANAGHRLPGDAPDFIGSWIQSGRL